MQRDGNGPFRRPPPSLLSLTVECALLHIHQLPNLSSIPDHIVVDLFQRTLAAGRLTEAVLRVFLATRNQRVLAIVKALDIKPVFRPVLPTRCHDKF